MINIEQIEIIVETIVQDRNVSTTSCFKYLLTSQNPLSLTCDAITDPAAMANANNVRSAMPTFPRVESTGPIIPAPVIIDMVAEPCRIRTSAAIA